MGHAAGEFANSVHLLALLKGVLGSLMALNGQGAGDARRSGDVFGAGEAMGEDGVGCNLAMRPLQQSRQLLAGGVSKLESFLTDLRNCDLVHY